MSDKTKGRRAKHLVQTKGKSLNNQEFMNLLCDRAELLLDEAKQYLKISDTFIYQESI